MGAIDEAITDPTSSPPQAEFEEHEQEANSTTTVNNKGYLFISFLCYENM